MADVFTDILIVLASWRLTSLFAREDGPFNIFARFRHFIGVRYMEGVPVGMNFIAKAITCPWCFSVWVALPFAAMRMLYLSNDSILLTGMIYFFLYWFAYSTAIIITDGVIMKL